VRQFLLYGLYGVLAGGFFLVAHMPATQLVARMGDTGPLRLVGQHGTLWSGGARSIRLNDVTAGPLDWRWQPWRLLLGRIALELDSRHALLNFNGRLELPLTGGRAELLEASADADPMLTGLPLGGRLAATIASLTWSGETPQLDAGLVWRQASSALLPGVGLGEIEVVADGAAARVETRAGAPADVRLTGAVDLRADALHYRLDAAGLTRPGRESLQRLRGTGKPLADGGLRFEGDMRLML
jgi:hypothetical protein